MFSSFWARNLDRHSGTELQANVNSNHYTRSHVHLSQTTKRLKSKRTSNIFQSIYRVSFRSHSYRTFYQSKLSNKIG